MRMISAWISSDFSGFSGQGMGILKSFTFASEIAGYADPL